jgi:hydrogenase maturation protein HypF
MEVDAVEILVRGVVQGVGFRPFVYRLASQLRLSGWVSNDGGGVRIHAEGAAEDLARFDALLPRQAPAAATIDEVTRAPVAPAGLASFRILPSRREGGAAARVPPDRAACPDCRRDILNPSDRRHGYALTTCTDCGPRYSILRRLPFDRPDTR